MLQFDEEPDNTDSIVDPEGFLNDINELDLEEVEDEADDEDNVFHSFGFL